MSQGLTEQFKAFVESKPADETYDYWSFSDCPVAQFGRRAGLLSDGDWYNSSDATTRLHAQMGCAIGNDGVGNTFGALAERLAQVSA